MPASDGLQPPKHNEAERDVIKSYGGWTAFCNAHGYRPWDDEDAEDAEATLRG